MNIRKKIFKFLKAINREVDAMIGIPKAISICKGKTYYPDKKRKSRLEIVKDNVLWLLKFKEVNRFYYAYGLDVVSSKMDKYVDYLSFMTARDNRNKPREADSQAAILRDKYLFYKYMSACNLPTPKVTAVIWDGILYDADMNQAEKDIFEKGKKYFIKSVSGECASFVKKYDGEHIMKEMERFDHGGYIVQKECKQCEKMCMLNSSALNTLRIVTVNIKGAISVFSALLRVGTSETGCVDNWAAGGLAVGIEPTGQLKKYGFSKPDNTGGGGICAPRILTHRFHFLLLQFQCMRKRWI